jgi:hypothetical protein
VIVVGEPVLKKSTPRLVCSVQSSMAIQTKSGHPFSHH